MRRRASYKLGYVAALIVLLAFVVVGAQAAAPPKYATSSEVKVKGLIEEVKSATDNTVHLTLKNEKGSLDVTIAPEKFLKEMGISFAKGDTIEVLGSELTGDGNPVMLAREVTCNGDVMTLRDEKGKPVWEGWSR